MGRMSRRGTLPWEVSIRRKNNTHLAGGLVEAERVAELLLGDGTAGVDLVAEDEEGDVGEGLDGDWC